MPGNYYIHRAHDLAFEIAEQNAYIREAVAKSREILRTPIPDTFLGRKTRESAPDEEREP